MAGAGHGTKNGRIPATKGERVAKPIEGARASAAAPRGGLMDVTASAKAAGFALPARVTRSVIEDYVKPGGASPYRGGDSKRERMKSMFHGLSKALGDAGPDAKSVTFQTTSLNRHGSMNRYEFKARLLGEAQGKPQIAVNLVKATDLRSGKRFQRGAEKRRQDVADKAQGDRFRAELAERARPVPAPPTPRAAPAPKGPTRVKVVNGDDRVITSFKARGKAFEATVFKGSGGGPTVRQVGGGYSKAPKYAQKRANRIMRAIAKRANATGNVNGESFAKATRAA